MVLLVFVMCGLVLWGYVHHQNELAGSLVSPLPVLKVSDDLNSFEIKERVLIEKSLNGVDWGENNFEYDFLVNFLSGIDSDMESFILDNLFWNGVLVPVGEDFDEGAFFRNVLYSVDFDDESLVLSRNEIGKKISLDASAKSRVSFPVEFYFEYGAKYLISKNGNKFVIERI
jgi:hypothetical protein